MVDRVALSTAVRGDANLIQFLDSGDSRVAYNWDFRGTSLLAGWVENGTGHQYSETDGVNCGVNGHIVLSNLDDTDLIGEGTILIEVEREAISFDAATHSPTVFFDSVGRTAANQGYLLNINESGGFVREIQIMANGLSGGVLSLICEGAYDDNNQPVRFFNAVPPDSAFDSRWCVVALTWKSGRIYVIADCQVLASFGRDVIDGDIDDIALCGRGTARLGDYWIRRAQALNVCVAPKVVGPRQAIIGDSFALRFTAQQDASAETLTGYLERQGTLTYHWADAGVLTTKRHTELMSPNWGQSNAFTLLQAIAVQRYGVWPSIFNAAKNGRQWRSDLGQQINSAQTSAVIDYDPEILWCIGSVNDINLADTVDDIVTDAKALVTTMISGCRNLRKVYFVETFATPLTYLTNSTNEYLAEENRLRLKLAQLDGFTVTNAAGIDISVEFVPTRAEWAPSGIASARYGIGSHPDNATSSAVTPTVSGDVHLTAEGSIKVAEILKDRFLAELVGRP